MFLKRLEFDSDIRVFGNYILTLIKYHQEYANKIGLFDKVVDSYTYKDAIRHIGEDGYHQYLIVDEDRVIVGALEYKHCRSEIDDKDIIYLKKLYIIEEYRGKGIATEVINHLKKKGYRIELECWYGIPANEFYKSLGASEIKTRYMI